jgi:hypothetical protein
MPGLGTGSFFFSSFFETPYFPHLLYSLQSVLPLSKEYLTRKDFLLGNPCPAEGRSRQPVPCIVKYSLLVNYSLPVPGGGTLPAAGSLLLSAPRRRKSRGGLAGLRAEPK